ncbi:MULTISPECIES: HAD domain-containing protein [unclassified Roseateles]|uniref:HAD domain-containing protein n=1 Tax=unclassified Roseateles TaxID=2626991 RepID=UPI00138F3150
MSQQSPSAPGAIYLGISGVLHPSRSLYELAEARSPEDDGHTDYEAAPILDRLLSGWPRIRIVLTSTQPRQDGLHNVLIKLGEGLASRVIGHTYEDLTTKAKLGPRQRPLSVDDYWRCNKSDIVRLHQRWLRPVAWVAVDDETILWTPDERLNHLVAVDGCKGLLDPAAQDRLLTLLYCNFGSPKT